MAGRGVDIKLGEGVTELGGLYVLGTERHESRRIDNQLRGRSGRQGDPGETRFYLSGEDDLVRLFAGDRIKGIMERFKIPDDQPMEAKILSRQIEGAQKKVEEQNFVMRKNVLKYDDVLNRHRGRIYEQRRQVLEGEDMSEQVKLWIDEVIDDVVTQFTQEQYSGGVGPRGAHERDGGALSRRRSPRPSCARTCRRSRREALIEEFQTDARDEYDAKEEEFGSELMRELERFIILQVVDVRWREHLENMDYLPRGHRPARDGAEGSARRVHRRGRAHVHRPSARSAARSSSISSTRSSRPSRRSRSFNSSSRTAAITYEHDTPAGAEAIAAAAGAAPASTLGALAGGGADRAAREGRPQRSVLVRLRQEVQEVPRRLSRR